MNGFYMNTWLHVHDLHAQDYVIFWVVGEKCVWLQNKERIDTHNNTVMML